MKLRGRSKLLISCMGHFCFWYIINNHTFLHLQPKTVCWTSYSYICYVFFHILDLLIKSLKLEPSDVISQCCVLNKYFTVSKIDRIPLDRFTSNFVQSFITCRSTIFTRRFWRAERISERPINAIVWVTLMCLAVDCALSLGRLA